MWNDDGDDDDDDDASAHNVVKCEQVRGGINCILGHAYPAPADTGEDDDDDDDDGEDDDDDDG